MTSTVYFGRWTRIVCIAFSEIVDRKCCDQQINLSSLRFPIRSVPQRCPNFFDPASEPRFWLLGYVQNLFPHELRSVLLECSPRRRQDRPQDRLKITIAGRFLFVVCLRSRQFFPPRRSRPKILTAFQGAVELFCGHPRLIYPRVSNRLQPSAISAGTGSASTAYDLQSSWSHDVAHPISPHARY